MPTSRDFPFNGIDLIKKWREQIIDELIHEVNENISIGIKADLKRIDRLIKKMNNDDDKNLLKYIKTIIQQDNIDD
jgi:hypothetical protein